MSEILNDLIEIGLTEYEAKVYSALLLQELLTASDITKIGDVPRGRVYDIINQLIEKGFCVTVPGAVKKFRAVDPDAAIRNLVDQRKNQERRMLTLAEKLQVRYNNKKVNATPLDYIQVLTSKQSQVNKFIELEKNARKFCLGFNKKPYVENEYELENLKRFGVPEKSLIKRGIITKGIYEADDDKPELFLKLVDYFESLGEEIRISKKLPMKMFISDTNTVMISLRNEGSTKFNLSSMVVEHTDLTKALIELFEFHWKTSMTKDEYLTSIKLKQRNKETNKNTK